MNNGFIYPLIEKVIQFLNGINVVEFFKFVAEYYTSVKEKKEIIKNKNIAIDVFIVLKWVIVLSFWLTGWKVFFAKIVVFYLLFMNLHTYFYYHVWCDRAISEEGSTHERLKRRFVNLLLAIGFSIISYGYLYHICYMNEFSWPSGAPKLLDAIQFSIANFITGTSKVEVVSNEGNVLVISQYILTFMFVAIVLTRSIPQKINNQKEV